MAKLNSLQTIALISIAKNIIDDDEIEETFFKKYIKELYKIQNCYEEEEIKELKKKSIFNLDNLNEFYNFNKILKERIDSMPYPHIFMEQNKINCQNLLQKYCEDRLNIINKLVDDNVKHKYLNVYKKVGIRECFNDMSKVKRRCLIDNIFKHCGTQNRVLIKGFIYDCNKILKKYIENHIREVRKAREAARQEARLIRELELRDYYYSNYHRHEEFDVEEELNYL